MTFKPGVQIRGLRTEIATALVVASHIHPFVVTSVSEGDHSRGSLHYAGSAFDLRTRDINPADIDVFANRLRAGLTDEFDVVVERDHIHVEFQPKAPIP